MNNNGTFNANDARPNFPWPVQHTNTRDNNKIWVRDRPVPLNYEIPMDWHHMIPWNVLRDSWSALATSARWEVLEAWLGLLSVNDADQRLAEMKAGTLGPVDAQDITEKLCWARWNLVEGPYNGNRTDDPGGDGFDDFAYLAMSSNVRARAQVLKSIYTTVKDWTYNDATLTKTGTKGLLADLGKVKAYKQSPIAMFEGKAWSLVDAGKIDKFGLTTSGGRHPTWKKAR